jgi:hypothetical protein
MLKQTKNDIPVYYEAVLKSGFGATAFPVSFVGDI